MKIRTQQLKNVLSTMSIGLFTLLPSVAGAQTNLENPLAANNLQEFLTDIVEALIVLSIPVIVFFIIYAGFTFVTSGGDTSKIEKAKKTALYTVIGAAVILGASLIAGILEGTYESIDGS